MRTSPAPAAPRRNIHGIGIINPPNTSRAPMTSKMTQSQFMISPAHCGSSGYTVQSPGYVFPTKNGCSFTSEGWHSLRAVTNTLPMPVFVAWNVRLVVAAETRLVKISVPPMKTRTIYSVIGPEASQDTLTVSPSLMSTWSREIELTTGRSPAPSLATAVKSSSMPEISVYNVACKWLSHPAASVNMESERRMEICPDADVIGFLAYTTVFVASALTSR